MRPKREKTDANNLSGLDDNNEVEMDTDEGVNEKDEAEEGESTRFRE